MTTFVQGNFVSYPAGVDLTGKLYTIVKTDANNNIVPAAAAADAILGVLNNEPKLGDIADVALINGNGTFKVVAGGAITKDALLTTNAAGLAVVAVAGNRVFGRAVTAGAVDDVVEYIRYNEIAAA